MGDFQPAVRFSGQFSALPVAKRKKQSSRNVVVTLPETNIAPENGWLEYYFPFGMANFQVLC